MKKIIFSLVGLTFIISLTGCGIKEEGSQIKLEKGNFSIICDSKTEDFGSIKTQNKTTYNFNKDKNLINYSIITTQNFKEKSVYEEYKKAQEETIKTNSSESILYNLKSNDSSKTLIFTMAITDINLDNVQNEEEKERMKASTILKNQTETNTCKVEGIDKSELK